jgi:hypothetical protein
MRRLLALSLVLLVLSFAALLSGSSEQRAPQTSAEPSPSIDVQAVAWRFEKTVLAAADANSFGRELMTALPTADGWLLGVNERPTRCLATDSWSCGMLVKVARMLVRVDAAGRVVAERRTAPAMYDGEMFAARATAVVQSGALYAIDLDTLETLATMSDSNIRMTRAGDRLFTWETYRRVPGATDLVERDPRTLAEIRRYPSITLDGLYGHTIVVPARNALAYTWTDGSDRSEIRIVPLDPSRPPDLPWLAGACWLERVGDGRVAVARGSTCGTTEAGATLELRDASDGRLIRSSPTGSLSSWLASTLIVEGDGLIDPGTGRSLPGVPGWVVAIDGDRAITRLGDGGATLLRLVTAGTVTHVDPVVVARATCAWPDFPRVATARAENIGCPELRAAAGGHRLVVSPGRAPASKVFDIISIDVLTPAHVLTIHYRQAPTSRYAGATAEAAVVDVPEDVEGDWLVWMMPVDAGRTYSGGPAFTVTFP